MALTGGGDLVADYAENIPVAVICQLLGGMGEEDQGQCRAWAEGLVEAVHPVCDDEMMRHADTAAVEFCDYFRDSDARGRRCWRRHDGPPALGARPRHPRRGGAAGHRHHPGGRGLPQHPQPHRHGHRDTAAAPRPARRAARGSRDSPRPPSRSSFASSRPCRSPCRGWPSPRCASGS